MLDVAADGTLRHSPQGEDIPDVQGGLCSKVHKLPCVHALSSSHQLGVHLKAVGISEFDDSQGSATGGLVNNVLHNTLDVSLALGVIEVAELHLSDTQSGVGLENPSRTFTATKFYATHVADFGLHNPGVKGSRKKIQGVERRENCQRQEKGT